MKKVELHLHLDGSLRVSTLRELSPLEYKEKIESFVSVNSNDRTLVDYLKKFDLPILIMQSSEVLERVAFELVEDLYHDDTIYAEIRVAPIQHMKEGLSDSEVVQSILKGIDKGITKYKIKVKLLLCAMRHLPEEENFFLIDLAQKFKDEGVVGLDLAGNEKDYPVNLFSNFFKKAKELNIPFTIHAGEATGYKSILDSIKLGAKRLGHGIRAYEDKETLKIIKNDKICLECCPISNFNTNAIIDFDKYPLREYLDLGLNVTLNSDNRTVSNTNFNKEIEFLRKHIRLTDKDILKMNINAINSAFISDEEKIELIKLLI
ncbi:MAG: adenosine deaminase [Spirochaetales bacterium]|nr:adenosine deaminase [Spirochaetales bacterium]